MIRKTSKTKITILFSAALILVITVFVLSILKTTAYNRKKHLETFSGETLFTEEADKALEVSVTAVPRSSTWTKLFDLKHEGRTKHDYQAFTYDFSVTNNTRDEISDFTFKLTFSTRMPI